MDKAQADLIAKLNATITAWKSEVAGAQERLTRQIVTASHQLDTLAGILSGQEGTASSSETMTRLASLEQELAARNEAAEQSQRRADELERTCTELTSEVQRMKPFEAGARTLAEEVKRLREVLQVSSAELEQARGRIAALEQAQSESASGTESGAALESGIQDLRARVDEAQGAAAQMVEEIEALRSDAGSAAARLSELQAENESLKQTLMAQEAVASDMKAARDSETLRATRAEVATLKEALAGKDRTALAATQHIVQLGQTVTRLEHELDGLRAEQSDLTALRAELEALRAENEGQAQTIARYTEEIASLNEAMAAEAPVGDARGEHLTPTSREQPDLQQEVLRLRAEAELLRARNEHLASRVEAMDAMQEIRKRQSRIALTALDAEGRPRKMGEILVAAGRITHEQLMEALGEQKQMSARLLGAILMEKEYVDEHDIAQVVSSQLHLPFMVVAEDAVSPEAAALVDGAFCAQHVCVPLRATPDLLVLAMANPLDSITIERIQTENSRRVLPVVATPSDITAVIDMVYGVS